MPRSPNGRLTFRGLIIRPDGSEAFETSREGNVKDAVALGTRCRSRAEGARRARFFYAWMTSCASWSRARRRKPSVRPRLLRARGHRGADRAGSAHRDDRRCAISAAAPWSAVMMTSGNAARALTGASPANEIVAPAAIRRRRSRPRRRRVTPASANVISADGDGGDLVRLVAGRLRDPAGPLLYLAGSDRARDLGRRSVCRRLAGRDRRGLSRDRRHAHCRARLWRRCARARSTAFCIIHGAARPIFVDCAEASGVTDRIRALSHYCLSARAAEPLRTVGAADIRIAAHPDEASLLALILPG